MTGTVTLEIKAEDIFNSNYTDTDKCALTKAWRRLGEGFENFADVDDGDVWDDCEDVVVSDNYLEIQDRVKAMYAGDLAPEDFTATVEFHKPIS